MGTQYSYPIHNTGLVTSAICRSPIDDLKTGRSTDLLWIFEIRLPEDDLIVSLAVKIEIDRLWATLFQKDYVTFTYVFGLKHFFF